MPFTIRAPSSRTHGRAPAIARAMLLAVTLASGRRLAAQQATDTTTRTAVLSLLVVDDDTDAPLPGVAITIPGLGREWTTDAKGMFILVAPTQRFVLTLRRLGYEPGAFEVELAPGDTARPVYNMRKLSATAQALDTMRVQASGMPSNVPSVLQGFESRRLKYPGGRFLTREEIRKTGSTLASGVLRRVSGVVIFDSLGRKYAASSRGPKVDLLKGVNAPCIMRVVLDGLMMSQPFSIDDIPITDLYGIEVYSGLGTVPSEFSGGTRDAFCGLIVVWRRVQ